MMRVSLQSCHVPGNKGFAGLPDTAFTASSYWNNQSDHAPWHSRLHYAAGGCLAWASWYNNAGQWIQVDLGEERMTNGIAIQGRHDAGQWVTSFTVSYSNDLNTWTGVQDGQVSRAPPRKRADHASCSCAQSGSVGPKTFTGNTNNTDVVTCRFAKPFKARYVRVYPTAWHGHMRMRWNLY